MSSAIEIFADIQAFFAKLRKESERKPRFFERRQRQKADERFSKQLNDFAKRSHARRFARK